MASKLDEQYRILATLGQGAAGTVHLATPRSAMPFAKAGELVALKCYKERILEEPNQAGRIRREFRIGSQIVHPALVRILDHVLDGDTPFLVMEYIDGFPLDKWLAMFHPVSPRCLLRFAATLAQGLAKLHETDIIHRDLKPENVMISESFAPKIMDFGVVHTKADSGQTPDEKFLGTIRNSSPELLNCREWDKRTDLYSFGTILFAMLHG